jgi:hypothetical protein
MFHKRVVVDDLLLPYAVNTVHINEKMFIGAGSEGPYPSYLIDMSDFSKTVIAGVPGGTMSIVPARINNTDLVSVMGLFPPFIGYEAGIYRHSPVSGHWHTEKIISLPFAHRCEILNRMGSHYLFISSVSRYKENPADWSRPGELYIVPFTGMAGDGSPGVPFFSDIYKNHGMIRSTFGGKESVSVSGENGIYAIVPDRRSGWEVHEIYDREVSEFEFFDVDNDGVDELITIEPFHGNALNIYKRNGGGWSRSFQSELSFGHGLSSGLINGVPSIAVGNREGDKALMLFSIHSLGERQITLSVIEENAGPTQTRIVRYKSADYILSSNQAKGEIALYNI